MIVPYHSRTDISSLAVPPHKGASAGRPSSHIPKEILADLRCQGFAWVKIAYIFKVSRWTIMRRVNAYGLSNLHMYSPLTDEELDSMIWKEHRKSRKNNRRNLYPWIPFGGCVNISKACVRTSATFCILFSLSVTVFLHKTWHCAKKLLLLHARGFPQD